jgi:hypothetical protein
MRTDKAGTIHHLYKVNLPGRAGQGRVVKRGHHTAPFKWVVSFKHPKNMESSMDLKIFSFEDGEHEYEQL